MKKTTQISQTIGLDTYDAYMKNEPLEQRLMIEYIAEKYRSNPHLRIVELGAGTGRFTKLLLARFPTAEITLVEPDQNCCQLLKNIGGAKLLEAGAEDFASVKPADIIVMATAFHHVSFENQLAALKNIQKHLKKDGWFLCGDNFLAEYETTEERETVLRKSMRKWIAEAETKKEKDMAKKLSELVLRDDHGGEYFICPSVFEALATKAKLVLKGKANATNTHALDMEHYFYLFAK
jgi:trans-aconitate methyltransferase